MGLCNTQKYICNVKLCAQSCRMYKRNEHVCSYFMSTYFKLFGALRTEHRIAFILEPEHKILNNNIYFFFFMWLNLIFFLLSFFRFIFLHRSVYHNVIYYSDSVCLDWNILNKFQNLLFVIKLLIIIFNSNWFHMGRRRENSFRFYFSRFWTNLLINSAFDL